MFIRILLATATLLMLSACAGKNIQTKEAVKEAVNDHLAKVSGLDLSKMDVEISNMSFQESTAEVSVTIAPKGMPSDGMQMAYQLKREGDKWAVAGKKSGAAGAGHGNPMPPPASGGGAMPPGHPPVAGGEKK